MNYVHCDYCDAHTPVNADREDWVQLQAIVSEIVNSTAAVPPVLAQATLDFCPVCAYRVTDDLVMMLKRGASVSVPGQGKVDPDKLCNYQSGRGGCGNHAMLGHDRCAIHEGQKEGEGAKRG